MKKMVFALIVMLALFATMIYPAPAHADGETPTSPPLELTEPPVDSPTALEEPVITALPTDPTEVVTEVPPLVEGIPPEVAPTETPTPTSTEEPALSEVSPISAPPTADPVQTANVSPETMPTEEPSLTEALRQLPAETDVVVLDENGQSMPLATEETVLIIAQGDPIWCPVGVNPIANTGGCTTSYTSLQALLDYLDTNEKSQPGKIWIEDSYVSSANDPTSTGFLIDGNTFTTMRNYAIILQGGWNGSSTGGISGVSDFVVPFSITNWTGDITLNNINFSSSISDRGNSLSITSVKNVTINNSSINKSGYDYKALNITSANNVTITDSSVRGYYGANLGNVNNINIQNSSFSAMYQGMYITNANTVNVSLNTRFNNGGRDGLVINGANNVSLNNSQFNNNGWVGARLSNVNNISVLNSTFNSNRAAGGLIISSSGSLTVDGSTFDGNSYNGMAVSSSGTVNIYDGNTFSNNDVGINLWACAKTVFIGPYVTFLNNRTEHIRLSSNCAVTRVPSTPEVVLSSRQEGEFDLSCIGQNGFAIHLPNGDLVYIFCPVSGKAAIYRLENTALPASLPEGFTYASGFTLKIIQKDIPITAISEGGYIRATFNAPSLQQGNTYSILYWDIQSSSWIPLKDFMLNPDGRVRTFDLFPGTGDMRQINSGVRQVIQNGVSHVDVSTNFPGIFVLAQH